MTVSASQPAQTSVVKQHNGGAARHQLGSDQAVGDLATFTIQELAARLAFFEAQSLKAAQDVHRLYQAERQRRYELELARAQLLAYAHDLRAAFQAERARRAELERAYLDTVRALAGAIEARDPYTGGHVDRVASYAVALGRELGLDEASLRALEIGALLHDIGKIAIPDAVLLKRGPLSQEEWECMRQHPQLGASMVRAWAALQPALPAVLHHHERYDGGGYPAGLEGLAIPPAARIVAVVDAFDAMLTTRPYRQGLPLETALRELERCAGSQFDPEYVQAFIAMIGSRRLKLLRADAEQPGPGCGCSEPMHTDPRLP